MCFEVDKKAKRPRITTAYKVVTLRRGYLDSLVYGFKNQTPWSYPGRTVRCSEGPTTYETPRLVSTYKTSRLVSAKHGIYVYTSRRRAEKAIRKSYRTDLVILAVSVSPSCWLHTSTCGTKATYYKVTIKEQQPYLDWI
jgi:hypothetical protein